MHFLFRMISEVELLVGELRRITLLWDELWLGTLNQHHADVTRRLNQLDNEVKKVITNASLSKEEKTAIIAEKHRTVLKPVSISTTKIIDYDLCILIITVNTCVSQDFCSMV